MSYEEEDTCVSYEEEDTCVSYEEEDTCVSYEEEDTCVSYEEEDTCVSHIHNIAVHEGGVSSSTHKYPPPHTSILHTQPCSA